MKYKRYTHRTSEVGYSPVTVDEVQNPATVFIEAEGLLFRGPAHNHPAEIWNYARKCWVKFKGAGPQLNDWGKEIFPTRAEQLKNHNPDAEHYLYYDSPPWL